MSDEKYNRNNIDIAWCPGCGNFKILDSLKLALSGTTIEPTDLVISSGIGQAPKTPHYMQTNIFNGLHGRALPVATAIKACNTHLAVIALGGDGDMYGEGGNHFIHAIRRNPNIAHLVHNNMVYGLTKGQASPTSQQGFTTPVQTEGVSQKPFNPLAVAVSLDASFVARVFCGDTDFTASVIRQAVEHPGYALVDIFQPCVSFNRTNNFKWFKDNTYRIGEQHDPEEVNAALSKAMEKDPYPTGVIYRNPSKPTFESQLPIYRDSDTPLFERNRMPASIERLIDTFK